MQGRINFHRSICHGAPPSTPTQTPTITNKSYLPWLITQRSSSSLVERTHKTALTNYDLQRLVHSIFEIPPPASLRLPPASCGSVLPPASSVSVLPPTSYKLSPPYRLTQGVPPSHRPAPPSQLEKPVQTYYTSKIHHAVRYTYHRAWARVIGSSFCITNNSQT